MTSGTGCPYFVLALSLTRTEPRAARREIGASPSLDRFNVASRLWQQASQQGERSAVTTPARTCSYHELMLAAQQIARELRQQPNFHQGARVLLLLGNSVEYIAAFYGTLLADGVVVPLPPNSSSQSLDEICSSTSAIAVIVSADAKRQPALIEHLPQRQLALGTPSRAIDEPLPWPRRGDLDLAALFYTSGSMGSPKGVMLSHRNLSENADSIQQYLQIDSSDRPLCVLPFYHAFGNSVMQTHLLAGANLILDGKTIFPETLISAIERYGVTSLSAVPDLVRLLLERTSLGQTMLPSLRYVAVAGGALQHEMAIAMSHRLVSAKLYLMYGQTEATARLAYLPPEQLPRLPAGCIGRAIPGVELDVVDENGDRVAIGDIGELRARGANIMLGYWQDAETTAEKLNDGWLSTGDLAAIDKEGWLYYHGRRNAIVKIAGFRVHPDDLESFALRTLGARQAVAVPFEAPQVGTRLALFLGLPLAQEMSVGDLTKLCRAELPRHLVPSVIQLVHEFPLNSSLKIDRLRLSEMATRVQRGAPATVNSDHAVGKRGLS